ncbi:hypothetical protein AX14_008103 [Amanita brunnescens Koide BX004]|nr:hypothetical protein AX14_008103 [Amanita brunnescens Koide BX004]
MAGGNSDEATRAKSVGGSDWCTGGGGIAVTSAGGGTDEAAEDADMEAGRGNADPSAAGPGKCSRSVTTADGKWAPPGDTNRARNRGSVAGEGGGRSWHVGLGATSGGVEAAAVDVGEGNDAGGGSASTPSAGGWPTGDGIGDIAVSSDGKSSSREVSGMGGDTADIRGEVGDCGSDVGPSRTAVDIGIGSSRGRQRNLALSGRRGLSGAGGGRRIGMQAGGGRSSGARAGGDKCDVSALAGGAKEQSDTGGTSSGTGGGRIKGTRAAGGINMAAGAAGGINGEAAGKAGKIGWAAGRGDDKAGAIAATGSALAGVLVCDSCGIQGSGIGGSGGMGFDRVSAARARCGLAGANIGGRKVSAGGKFGGATRAKGFGDRVTAKGSGRGGDTGAGGGDG